MCRLKGVGSTYLDRYVWVIERERVSERVSERVREREREREREDVVYGNQHLAKLTGIL